MTNYTLTEAFAFFNKAKCKNPMWSWSARSEDGKTVVLTFWKDGIQHKAKPMRYASVASTEDKRNWIDSPGNRERRENLIWAVDHYGGIVHVVIVVAKDENAEPRAIKECYPQPNMKFRIVELNRETGEFVAEQVS